MGGFEYICCKLLSHKRMFYVERKTPNIVRIQLLGRYPEHLPSGLSNAREVLFTETFEDDVLYQLMQYKSRKRSKKIAEFCKYAIANAKEQN